MANKIAPTPPVQGSGTLGGVERLVERRDLVDLAKEYGFGLIGQGVAEIDIIGESSEDAAA